MMEAKRLITSWTTFQEMAADKCLKVWLLNQIHAIHPRPKAKEDKTTIVSQAQEIGESRTNICDDGCPEVIASTQLSLSAFWAWDDCDSRG